MHRRLDEVVDHVSKGEGTTTTVQEDVSEMKPVTAEVRAWSSAASAALPWGFGASALTYIIAKFRWLANHLSELFSTLDVSNEISFCNS